MPGYMDSNLEYWKSEGQSFLRRLSRWVDLLDPLSLLASDAEIKNARLLLESKEGSSPNTKVKDALKLSLSSVHPDTGSVIPLLFRPPAFLPIAAPLVIATMLPHRGIKPALFWQFLCQSYSAGFNYANRNATASKNDKMSLKQLLLIVGSVSYSACAGAVPQFMMKHYGLRNQAVQTFFRTVLPVPLFAFLGAFNVMIVRGEEFENGIEVFDANGNVVGVSQKVGLKAVGETAVSRALLIGTTAAVPNLLISFIQRRRFIQRSPLVLAPLRHIATAFVLGLMIPVSFSLFPHVGKVQKANLEEEFQTDTQLYYHRGL